MLNDLYKNLTEYSQNGKPAPDGFRIVEECCINCIYCYDESSITACTKFDMFEVEWFNVCNHFDGGDYEHR